MANDALGGIFGEKAPYLLTVLVGALGWGISHVADHLSAAATVEYRMMTSEPKEPNVPVGVKKVEITLHNLSLHETYYNTLFFIKSRSSSRLTFTADMTDARFHPAVIPTAPLWFGESGLPGGQIAIDANPDRVQFRVPQLPPDGRLALVAYYRGAGVPAFQVRLDSDAHESMRLVEASLETFIVRNETLLILQCLLALIVGYAALWSLQRMHRRWTKICLGMVGSSVVLLPSCSYAQDDNEVVVKHVHVVDVDSRQGIAIQVNLLPPGDKAVYFAEVDTDGTPHPDQPPRKCPPLHRLDVDVGSDYMHVDKPQACAAEVTIRLRRVPNASLAELSSDKRFWVSQAGDYGNQRYTEAGEINVDNVAKLKVAWTMSTGVLQGHEGAPLVIGDTLYFHTPFPNNVYAVNLNDQAVRWKYEPKQDADVVPVMCCDTVNRGLAYGEGKIFLQQADTTLVALDAETGAVIWTEKNGNSKVGETNTNAPHVFKDKVLTGISGGEFGVRGRVSAYDIKTGRPVWTGWSVGPDSDLLVDPQRTMTWTNGKMAPIGKDSSIKTWEGDQWKLGGGSTWGWYAYDPKLNLVYYGTGNPGTWNPSQRPGDNKWSMTIWARDLDTGQARWVYQMTPHDEWDYDGVNQMTLFDIEKGGRRIPALAHFDSNGYGYTLNRATGELMVAQKYETQANWASRIDMKTGRPILDSRYSPSTLGSNTDIKGICPAALGSKAQPASFDRQSGFFVVPTEHTCMTYEPFEIEYTAGQPYSAARLVELPVPTSPGGMGSVIAWDPVHGKTLWSKKEPLPVESGVLTTAGGLAFYGTLDGYIRAVSTKDGSEQWKFKMPSGVVGNVFSYEFRGKQYVGVYSGIGGGQGLIPYPQTDQTGERRALDEIATLRRTTNPAGVLFVFSLPGS